MAIRSITYACTAEHFGKDGATEEEMAGYRVYLDACLRAEFPGVEVTINKDGRSFVEADDAREIPQPNEVLHAIEKAWNSCRWEWVTK